jgi:hypothetical protein
MKFVLVNGRSPRPQSSCTTCGEPIRLTYLREIDTRMAFCDHDCYALRYKGVIPGLEIARRHHEPLSPLRIR